MTNPVQTLKALSEHFQDVELARVAVRAEILESINESQRLLACLCNCLSGVQCYFDTKAFPFDQASESEFPIHESNYLDALSFLSSWGLTLVPSSAKVGYFSVQAAE